MTATHHARLVVAVGLLLLAFACQAPRAFAAEPNRVLTYDVVRDGTAIGTQVRRFSGDDTHLEIGVSTNLIVKFAFIVVYRYEYEERETWEKGKLVALDSTTNDDGTSHRLSIRLTGDRLTKTLDGKTSEMSGDLLTDLLWNRDAVNSRALLSSEDGDVRPIRVEPEGHENVPARGKIVTTERFKFSGDLECRAWYAPDGTLIRVRYPGSDGSSVDFILK